LLPYKGVPDLLEAQAILARRAPSEYRLTLAGPGDLDDLFGGPVPEGVQVLDRLIDDGEALHLFRRCGLLVLPYRDATQSALVAAAYFFHKPVIVTRVGALPEVVEQGRTGWIVPPEDPVALAACLDEALANPRRLAQMGRNGRAWYDEQRTQEWEALLAMYRSLVDVGESLPEQR
jgi:glycosyltransferase involved in cell wall biosynthesis